MSNKLYVGSLSYSIQSDGLEKIFANVGTVVSAKVITDAHTGRSKGFGFVEMSTAEEAQRAIRELHGSVHEGRAIVVSEARPETKRGGGDRGRFSGNHRRDRGGAGRGEY